MRGGQAIGVRSAGSTHKLSLEVPTVLEVNGEAAEDPEADDGFPERNRKRSVSFHSLVIAEETAPVYEEQTSPSPNASSPSTKVDFWFLDKPRLKMNSSVQREAGRNYCMQCFSFTF